MPEADQPTMPTLRRTEAVLRAGQARGLHHAAQVEVRIGGHHRAHVAVGTTSAGAAVGEDAIFSWTCATKPVLAIGLGVLVDRGILDLDDGLHAWIPEAPAAWGAIRLTHLLTHTVGWVGDPGAVAAITEPSAAIQHVLAEGETVPGWSPGTRAAYSVWTGWLLLGEVLRRATGEDTATWLSREVLDRAGLPDTSLSLTAPAYDERAPRLVLLQHRSGDPHPYVLDGPHHAGWCWPGLSGRGPARDLARLFQVLSADATTGAGTVLSAATAQRLVRPTRVGVVDESTGVDHTWGLGLTVDRRAIHPKVSTSTFSHAGLNSSSVVFADPERALVVALVTDGIPPGLGAIARRFGVIQAVLADLTAPTDSTGRAMARSEA